MQPLVFATAFAFAGTALATGNSWTPKALLGHLPAADRAELQLCNEPCHAETMFADTVDDLEVSVDV